jgi:hypothetical protein
VTTRLIQHRSGLLPLPYLTNTSSATSAVRAGAIVLLPKALDVLLNPRVDRINNPTRRRSAHHWMLLPHRLREALLIAFLDRSMRPG